MPIIQKPGFSESTFAFAFTHDFVNRYRWRLSGLPYFPWIDEEGHLGWDVNIPFWGLSYFLQFKRGQLFEYRNGDRRFRFPVYKPQKSQQHNLLVAWASRERLTYYTAPCFTQSDELLDHQQNGTLLKETKLIPVRGMPTIDPADTTQHFVTYTRLDSGAFKSREVAIEGIHSAEIEGTGDEPTFWNLGLQRIDRRYVNDLHEYLSEIDLGHQERRTLSAADIERRPISSLRSRLRAVLGVEWILRLYIPTATAI